MPWTYSQSTGQLHRDGAIVGTGYSGAGTTTATGRNNGAMQAVANAGPIPTGQYAISGLHNSAQTGPNVMDLTPVGHNAFGRTSFQIHGNNAANNASHGCIILPPAVRLQIGNSGDTVLNVVP
jgi:hypothetical protein